MMIGFYNYTLVLTFLSLVSAVFGMTQASGGHFNIAVGCLAFAGLCDAFDGRVARTKKDRTDDECLFGVQLDSLCDVVAFGAFPPCCATRWACAAIWAELPSATTPSAR